MTPVQWIALGVVAVCLVGLGLLCFLSLLANANQLENDHTE